MEFQWLVRAGSLWIGAHYSPYQRQWCINFLPCITLRIKLKPKPEPWV